MWNHRDQHHHSLLLHYSSLSYTIARYAGISWHAAGLCGETWFKECYQECSTSMWLQLWISMPFLQKTVKTPHPLTGAGGSTCDLQMRRYSEWERWDGLWCSCHTSCSTKELLIIHNNKSVHSHTYIYII